MRERRRAVFLDKDGTLIEDVPYNVDPARITLLPGALDGLRDLESAGYALVVVSNQSGVARGLFDESALEAVRDHLVGLLARGGVRLHGFYWCPHHPEGRVADYCRECACRKPRPGLLEQAARELGIDLARSWMVGDILNDVEAGHRAGCRAVLLDNGGETEWVRSPVCEPEATVRTLAEAAAVILRADRAKAGAALARGGRGAGKPVADR
jgi:histidinol-phosphate phosphatase family protein